MLRPFIQFLFFILAFWIALTRISDYRHHPMDVVTGTIVGIAFSFLILFGLVDIFHRPRSFTLTKELRQVSVSGDYQVKGNLQRTISQETGITEVDGKKKSSAVSSTPVETNA